MRILKLVIWDLDQTILTGVLAEGEEEVDPAAHQVMMDLRKRGVLQALATHNQPELIAGALGKYDWSGWFVQKEAGLGSKIAMVRSILEQLGIHPLDSAFVDEDAFERDSIAAQEPGISAWSIAELQAYLNVTPQVATAEGLRRTEMYVEQQSRQKDEEASGNYMAFLRGCNIRIAIRPYVSEDLDRAKELLARTHQMNLGTLPLEEAVDRLSSARDGSSVLIAEMKDKYGDMGRCGVLHLRTEKGSAVIESLAISCRTRARGLALSMLVGLLSHPVIALQEFRCRYLANGVNRPLRLLLMAAGFQRHADSEELWLSADRLASTSLPDWIQISYS